MKTQKNNQWSCVVIRDAPNIQPLQNLTKMEKMCSLGFRKTFFTETLWPKQDVVMKYSEIFLNPLHFIATIPDPYYNR